MELVFLDVSELEPPGPMTEILFALSALSSLQCLHINHRKEPFPLYNKLIDSGWQYFCQRISSEQFHIFIYRIEQKSEFELMKKTLCGE